ncbi:MAG: hypothetical protein WDO17_25250 [Alphaproteobacteria bacterium]
MKIADREHMRRPLQVGADLENRFRPAPIGRAQKLKRIGCHFVVFRGKIIAHDVAFELLAQPGIVTFDRANDVHAPSRRPHRARMTR